MAPDANPLPLHGNRHWDCPHYYGCLDYARSRFHFWSCAQCEYRQVSAESGSEHAGDQIGMDTHQELEMPEWLSWQGRPEPQRSNSEELSREYIDYQMGVHEREEPHRPGGLNLVEIGVDFIDFQMGAQIDRKPEDPKWLAPEDVSLEFLNYSMEVNHHLQQHRI